MNFSGNDVFAAIAVSGAGRSLFCPNPPELIPGLRRLSRNQSRGSLNRSLGFSSGPRRSWTWSRAHRVGPGAREPVPGLTESVPGVPESVPVFPGTGPVAPGDGPGLSRFVIVLCHAVCCVVIYFCALLMCPVRLDLSWQVLSRVILSCRALSGPVQSGPVLPGKVLFCFFLSCPFQTCPLQSGPVTSCAGLSSGRLVRSGLTRS